MQFVVKMNATLNIFILHIIKGAITIFIAPTMSTVT